MNQRTPAPEGFWKLFTGRALLSIPSHLIGLFLPIFLFGLFSGEVIGVFLFYALGHLAYALLLPYGAIFLNRTGFRVSMVTSTIWNACFYAALLALSIWTELTFESLLLVGAAIMCLVLFRLTFWIPYHVEVAKLTDKAHRGFSISIILALVMFAGVVGPVVGGAIIQYSGFTSVFVIIALTSLLAFIPFWRLPPANEHFDWGYAETWRQFCKPEHRQLVLPMVANGVENVIGIVVWPIFIFLLLDGNYLAVGSVSSIIVLVTMLLQFVAGHRLDQVRKRGGMLHVGTVLSALGWVAKIFVVTSFHIFVAGVYHSITKVFTLTPFETLYYDLAADSGHYIDEITVLREIAIQVGKVLALVFVIVLSFGVAIQWTFLIAAIAALALNILYVSKATEHGAGGR